MTIGGTESILLACKAYRDRGYARGIKRPEMYVLIISRVIHIDVRGQRDTCYIQWCGLVVKALDL